MPDETGPNRMKKIATSLLVLTIREMGSVESFGLGTEAHIFEEVNLKSTY
jgi:hypothetical protein